jgi:hypothetical protein
MLHVTVLHQVSGISEPKLQKFLYLTCFLQKFLYLTCFEDCLKLPSAMLRNVADLSGISDAVVF